MIASRTTLAFVPFSETGYGKSFREDTIRAATSKLDPGELRSLIHEQARRGIQQWRARYSMDCKLACRLQPIHSSHLSAELVIAIDGHEVLSSATRCCADCRMRLKTVERNEKKQKVTEYYHSIVVAHWVGTHPGLVLDFEPVKPGKGELSTAYKLLARLGQVYGKAIGIVLADALYDCEPWRALAHKHGYRMVHAQKDKRRDPGRSARRALDSRDPKREKPDWTYKNPKNQDVYTVWEQPPAVIARAVIRSKTPPSNRVPPQPTKHRWVIFHANLSSRIRHATASGANSGLAKFRTEMSAPKQSFSRIFVQVLRVVNHRRLNSPDDERVPPSPSPRSAAMTLVGRLAARLEATLRRKGVDLIARGGQGTVARVAALGRDAVSLSRKGAATTIHTFERGLNGRPTRVSFRRLLENGQAHRAPQAFTDVGADRLERKLARLNAKSPHAAILPEDGSLNPRAFHLGFVPGDATSKPYIEQMALVGQVEDFSVVAVAGTPDAVAQLASTLDARARPNVRIVKGAGASDVWFEDSFEFTRRNEVLVPGAISTNVGKLSNALRGGRLERKVAADAFAMQGQVALGQSHESKVAVGLAGGYKVRRMRSYIEGGNVVPGTLPNGDAYAIVGLDSLALGRLSLETKQGQRAAIARARGTMATDLGVAPKNLHLVEQPGDFHLDMTMTAFGDRQIVLNDAREAARLQEGWMREDHLATKPKAPRANAKAADRQAHARALADWKQAGKQLKDDLVWLAAHVEQVAPYEDRAARDLTAQGFRVHRMGGVFRDPGIVTGCVPDYGRRNPIREMNFFNGEQGVNERGERFMAALGGDKRAEAFVAAKFLAELPTGLDRLHFLDRKLTPQTLSLQGGINCRAKGEGVVTLVRKG